MSDDLLVLGDADSISREELADADIRYFIHMRQVIAIKGLTPMREECIGILTDEIIRKTSMHSIGHRKWPIQNDLGCHAFTNKQPDLSFRPALRHPDVRPMLITEVAVHHEPLWSLLMEGRAWVQAPGVEYVILAKIFPNPAQRHVRVTVLERTAEPLKAELRPGDSLLDLVVRLEFRRLYRDPRRSGSVDLSFTDLVEYVMGAPEDHFHVLLRVSKPKFGGATPGFRSFSALARMAPFPAPSRRKFSTNPCGAARPTLLLP